MDEGTTDALETLLDRLRRGDPEARRELLIKAHHRLERLVASMLRRFSPELARRHDVESVLSETWIRLSQALESVEPATVSDFFGLAARKVRHVLLDLADRERRRASREFAVGDETENAFGSPSDSSMNPAKLAIWTEFHRRVELLDEEPRKVFEMHYYLDLPQVEIARVLELHPRKVSRLWITATESLADGLEQGVGFL